MKTIAQAYQDQDWIATTPHAIPADPPEGFEYELHLKGPVNFIAPMVEVYHGFWGKQVDFKSSFGIGTAIVTSTWSELLTVMQQAQEVYGERA